MKFRTFALFVAPSLIAMVVLIAMPLAGVGWLSLWNSYTKTEFVEVETRTPLGVKKEVRPRPVLDEDGQPVRVWEFYGAQNYRTVAQPAALADALTSGDLASMYRRITNIDFWGALEFTLLYTAVTTPFILALGFLLALAVNRAPRRLKGALIFISLMPFIITPVVGSLSVKWLFLDNAVITVLLQQLGLGKIYFLESTLTIRLLIILYGIWHVVPFAFIIFYAGLQTVPQDSLEAATVDGATRLDSIRYVVIPHLAPLILFVTLIHLMDAYRVFEPVLVFSGGQGADSLQHLTYYILNIEQNFFKASASAILTVIGIVLLLIPILRRTWRDQREGVA
jgi:multiple sugar transport system permease protein